jgi:Protein of unknown function (DUF4446)
VSDDVELWMVAAAGGIGLLALLGCLLLWLALRRVRSLQRVALPDGRSAGLVDRQAALQRGIDRVEEGLRDLAAVVDRQAELTEAGLRTSLRFQGMVRYDAYRDMGGQQSWSIALLDSTRTGAVITSLHARDHARVYLKELFEGVPTQRLSPEEERAISLALGSESPIEGAREP